MMKTCGSILAAALMAAALPVAVQAQQLTAEQLIQLATERGTCGDLVPVAARYEGGRAIVSCGAAPGTTPPVGMAGAGGLGATAAGMAVFAGLVGGGGSTSTTPTTTPSTN